LKSSFEGGAAAWFWRRSRLEKTTAGVDGKGRFGIELGSGEGAGCVMVPHEQRFVAEASAAAVIERSGCGEKGNERR